MGLFTGTPQSVKALSPWWRDASQFFRGLAVLFAPSILSSLHLQIHESSSPLTMCPNYLHCLLLINSTMSFKSNGFLSSEEDNLFLNTTLQIYLIMVSPLKVHCILLLHHPGLASMKNDTSNPGSVEISFPMQRKPLWCYYWQELSELAQTTSSSTYSILRHPLICTKCVPW